MDGVLARPKHLAVNKIGHAQHDLDPVFDAFSRTVSLAELAFELASSTPAEPETVVGFWFTLQDATVDNGCLWAFPGGHRLGLKRRFVRHGRNVGFELLDDTPWPDDGLVPLEAAKGTLVVLHGRLPHQSGANRSDRSRHAYSVHVIDGTAAYPEHNWLQRPSLPVRGFAPAVS